jgi:hypothetical protein
MKYLVFHSCGGCMGLHSHPTQYTAEEFKQMIELKVHNGELHFWEEGLAFEALMEALEENVPHPIYLSPKQACCWRVVVKTTDESWIEPDQTKDQQIRDAMNWYYGKIGPYGERMLTKEEMHQAYIDQEREMEGWTLEA